MSQKKIVLKGESEMTYDIKKQLIKIYISIIPIRHGGLDH